MRLIPLRASSRRLAAVLMLVCLWSLPHRSQTDDSCVTGSFDLHDESKHVFSSPTSTGHDEHCALCHWMRSLKPVFSVRCGPVVGRGAGSAVVDNSPRFESSAKRSHLPARAPPALL